MKTPLIRTIIGLCLSLMLIGGMMPSAFAEEETNEEELTFSDLSKVDRYYESVMYLYEEGIVNGYEDGTFQADNKVNRAEALKIILDNFEMIAEETEEALEFPDVDSEAWYYDHILTAYENGIVSGYPDGYFHPENSINLAETLKMILQAEGSAQSILEIGLEIDPALDVSAEDWYAQYAYYSLEHAIVTYADDEGNLNADQKITRGELCDLIYRLQNPGIFSGDVEYGQGTWYGDAVAGNHTADGGIFDPSQMTAAHKTLPFGTIIRVINLYNGKTVEVEITDRGPYGEGRIIDLSSSAFEVISSLGAGVIDVKIEVVYR